MFATSPPFGAIELSGTYYMPTVLLSVLIACLAAYTALSLNERVHQNSFFHRSLWLVMASLAMGFGIWAMHFIGMSAFSLPVEMTYDIARTVLSTVPAILASFLAFYFISRPRQTLSAFFAAGLAMGSGIALMHYTGMAAMKMNAVYTYDTPLVSFSVFIAVFISFIALYIFLHLQKYMAKKLIRLATAAAMGIAISSMHYTAMASMTFYSGQNLPAAAHAGHAGMNLLIAPVIIGILFLLGSLLFSSLMDRYIDYRISYFDGLTRLPNRRQFEKILSRKNENSGLAIWHFHNFEKINHTYGYAFGDRVIQHIATELKEAQIGFTDLFRIEGNRFAFLTQGVELTVLQQAMEAISLKWKNPFFLDGQWLDLSSVCALSAVEGTDKQNQLYVNALAVLEHPLLTYDHDVIAYDASVHRFSFDLDILKGLTSALTRNELFLVFQPKISAGTNEVIGYEALIRWNHPVHGTLPPGLFIPILEQNHRIDEVTDWVIDRAARQIVRWEKMGLPNQKIAVNIPGEYVTSVKLIDALQRTLDRYQVNPQQIELEITETSVVQSAESAIRAISAFRKQGFTVALDDFGTGVSSLSFLRQMPITTLKIDKSFVDRVPHSEKDSAILHAIVTLGQSLNLQIVIEGVETAEQARFLLATSKALIIQGYYYAKPMTPSELAEWRHPFGGSAGETLLS